MKIIQLTDIHYGAKGEAIYGREPSFALRLAIESINEEHSDAEFAILTGDLTHKGSVEAYRYLKEDLDRLKMPYYLILGNHDDRLNAKKVFGMQSDCNGFMQYAFMCKNNSVFLMLDTLQGFDTPYTHAGFYCQKRLEWLQEKLAEYRHKSLYICMHHAPFDTGIKAMDSIGLNKVDSMRLYEILQTHENIRHLFFGHYHSTMAGKWGHISFSSLKGISHQVKLDLHDESNVWLDFKSPEYGVILLDNQGELEPPTICVHYKDFMFDKHICVQEPM